MAQKEIKPTHTYDMVKTLAIGDVCTGAVGYMIPVLLEVVALKPLHPWIDIGGNCLSGG